MMLVLIEGLSATWHEVKQLTGNTITDSKNQSEVFIANSILGQIVLTKHYNYW